MFGFWKKTKILTAEEMMDVLQTIGIECKSAKARASVIHEVQDHHSSEPSPFVVTMCAMGDEQLDPETYEQMPWLSDDVWHFDYEAIEDHGAYKGIVANCVRLSGGDLPISNVSDFVDIEDEKAWVEFNFQGKKRRIELRVDNDWADPGLFVNLNKVLAECGSNKRFAQHDLGQDCLIICKDKKQIDQINKATKLKFGIEEG